MAAGRKQQLVVAVVAMLLVAGAAAQDCGVGESTRNACLSYCSDDRYANACCRPMSNANMGCLCNYWRKYNSVPFFAKCAAKIRSSCAIRMAC
ncbi:hypothetical protein SETIT_5G425500v2 [Setaria italica]|uniref:Bifunctional inhibitor/plant lipid transfer protein/seed storage helical domain-containing protein n=1 Tax=Setaria italica TaxID=4555 RepID=A0A368RF00_SETIT|nr:hypothetical protein SETIT_5G425500v2 [Setaria italica]